MADDADRDAVRALLGREPQGDFAVAVRDRGGGPVVIRNAPLLDDGRPMPTRYWLVGAAQVRAVSRLEADGGVRAAEAAIPPAALAAAHERYARERDAVVPADAVHRPSGGVGGSRAGVKCLHAHYAWHLAGGDDPVGRWVADQLAARLEFDIGPRSTLVSHAGHDARMPVGPESLAGDELAGADPPTPAQLTNALGAVADHLDDVLRLMPAIVDAADVTLRGGDAWHLAVVEHGEPLAGPTVVLERAAAEDVFRTLATERRADRLHNPALQPERVDTIVGTCCLVLGVMRTLQLRDVRIIDPAEAG